MQQIPIERRQSASAVEPDLRELFERIERLQRRIAAMAEASLTGDGELRRQRAAGRRP